MDLGVYPAHAVNLFLGEPAELTAYGSHASTGVEAHAAALLELSRDRDGAGRPPRRCSARLEVTLPSRLEVYCTDGRIMIDDFFLRAERAMVIRGDAEPEVLVAQWPGGATPSRAQEVMRCLRAGELQSPLVPWADTLAVARTLDRLADAVGGDRRRRRTVWTG